MTIHEISTQLFNLSVDHHFNGERFTKRQLEFYIANAMRNSDNLKIRDRFVMEIHLKDGSWLFTVNKFSNESDGFDYYIPDTREQEARLWESLTN